MIKVEKAIASDFNNIYPLLEKFNNPNISIDDWKKLFSNFWNNEEDYCGYMLKDDDKIVGYLGLIFHKRIISNRVIKFCNMSSWIVEEEYRDKGALLLLPVLRLENYIITNLTPSDKVCEIMEKLNFTLFENNFIYFYPFPRLSLFFDRKSTHVKITLDREIIKGKLNEKDLRIYNDHVQLKCHHALIENNGNYCYIIFTRPIKKKMPFGHFQYISNHDLFFKCFNKLQILLPIKLKIVSFIIDERFVLGRNVKGFLKFKHNRYYKSNYEDFHEKFQIDNLYSELPILGL
jgi:hypothetical protein